MATFRPGDAVPVRRPSSPTHRAALVAGVALLGLLTACGTDHGAASPPQKLSGTAEPASGDKTTETTGTGAAPTGSSTSSAAASNSSSTSNSSSSSSSTGSGSSGSTRCHTSELRATVGANNPGAGQENFPIVLTNISHRTCTLRGFPGAAFVNASGKQLGPDPKRSAATPTTVTLTPGRSAWAGLTFSNPEISGAKTATPATLIVTPPDERDPLKVAWQGGEVPVSGNASSVSLTVVQSGTGA
jgi:hypothetical protein